MSPDIADGTEIVDPNGPVVAINNAPPRLPDAPPGSPAMPDVGDMLTSPPQTEQGNDGWAGFRQSDNVIDQRGDPWYRAYLDHAVQNAKDLIQHPFTRSDDTKPAQFMSPDTAGAITQAAQEAGENPAYALATADRESAGNPEAKASKSMYGLFQMSGPLREQYGIGDSNDPYTQARGWTAFMGDVRKGMADRLGRPPTDAEAYLGHYFGEGRAARMIGQLPPETDVRDVFTPQEMAQNPEIAKAGTTGALMAAVTGDINRRMARYGGNVPNVQSGTINHPASNPGQASDFAMFGTVAQAPDAPVPDESVTGAAGENQTPPQDEASDFHQASEEAAANLQRSGEAMRENARIQALRAQQAQPAPLPGGQPPQQPVAT